MKNKDFASLAKRLLPDLPGFVVKGPMVVVAPIKYAVRGLYFEGSDFDKDAFYVWVFFLPMYVPTSHISFTLGKRIAEGGGGTRWNATAPNLVAELSASVKREALPFLSGIESPRDVASAAASSENRQDPYIQQAIAYSWARAGDIDQAVTALDQLGKSLDLKVSWQSEMANRARELRTKLVTNSAEARQQLETWEMESLRNLGLLAFC